MKRWRKSKRYEEDKERTNAARGAVDRGRCGIRYNSERVECGRIDEEAV